MTTAAADTGTEATASRFLTSSAWRVAALALAAAVFAGVVVMTAFAAAQIAADSDGASLVLEGHSIIHGHLLLQGWALSLDSFWTSEVPFYAAGDALAGVSPALLTFIPAVLYALVVLLGTLAAGVALRGRAAAIGMAAAFALLAFPTWASTLFVLRGGHHMGAVIWSLAAFLALCLRRVRLGVALAVVCLLLGMLGDLLTVAYGTLPLVCAGATRALRERRATSGILLAGAGVGSGLLYLAVHELVRHLGGFTSSAGNGIAHTPHQLLANLRHLYSLGGELIGLKSTVFGTNGTPGWLEAFRVIGGLVVVACCVAAAARVLWGIASGTRRASRAADWRGDLDSRALVMDDLLVFASLGSAGSYLLLAAFDTAAFTRYLAPAAIFMSVLTGRMLCRLYRSLQVTGLRRLLLAAGSVVSLMLLAGFADRTSRGPAQQPGVDLAAWLEAHGLRHGVGDYWAASITTVVSHGRVQVRPVVPNPAGRLVRYDRESDASWYRDQGFEFLVFQEGAASTGIDARLAVRTWGRPAHSYVVGSYHVLVWSHPIVVSAVGGFAS